MYDRIPVFLGAVILILGLFMAIAPKSAAKKEFRDDEEQVKKIRRNGIIMLVLGIAVIIVGLI